MVAERLECVREVGLFCWWIFCLSLDAPPKTNNMEPDNQVKKGHLSLPNILMTNAFATNSGIPHPNAKILIVTVSQWVGGMNPRNIFPWAPFLKGLLFPPDLPTAFQDNVTSGSCHFCSEANTTSCASSRCGRWPGACSQGDPIGCNPTPTGWL